MTNPIRLYRLTELREQAGLTLTEMAELCGLYGTTSRRAVSAWEAGTSVPRANRRLPFVRYLWQDLQLHKEPAAFDELWSMLVEEWEWDPLSAAERAQLLVPVVPPTPMDAEPEEAQLTDNPNIAPVLSSVAAEVNPSPPPSEPQAAADPAMANVMLVPAHAWLQVIPQRLGERRWLLVTIPLLLIWFGSQAFWRQSAGVPPEAIAADALTSTAPPMITESASPTSTAISTGITTAIKASVTAQLAPGVLPEREISLRNGGFEEDGGFGGWSVYEACGYSIQRDGAMAHEGVGYLAIRNDRPRCYSFYQDLFGRPAVRSTVRTALWLRSATGDERRGRLTLWAFGGVTEKAERHFAVSTMTWTCVENALTIHEAGHEQLRFEIYLDSHDGLDYYVDSAMVGQGPESLCPPTELAIDDLQLVQPSGKFYPAATVGVQATVRNVSAVDLAQESQIRYWVSETENGSPIEGSFVLPVPPLTASASVVVEQYDLYLPINLPTDQQYYLVADVAMDRPPDDYTLGFDRTSQPFTVTPCSQGTLYCDVPADHWAATEIQAWFDAGISQGCRSGTDPFINRPFCPDSLVRRWMMVFFLMRRLEGKEFQPQNAYQGLFEDLPEDFDSHQGALWVEALTTQRVDLKSDACPPRGEHRRFCPNDPLRRVDFALALAALQRWDLTTVDGTYFADMTTGSETARAAEYMAQEGYLPEIDTACPSNASYPRFCPNAPLRRASAAVMMSRALALVAPVQ